MKISFFFQAIGVICLGFSSSSLMAQVAVDPCVTPTQAQKNLKLFVAIDANDLNSTIAAISQAAINCPYPVTNGSGQYEIPSPYDTPLYHASKPNISPTILGALIKGGAKIPTDLPPDQKLSAVKDAYYAYHVSQLVGGSIEMYKASAPQYLQPSAVETTEEFSVPLENRLTTAELNSITVTLPSTDPWAQLASQAPLTSTIIGGQHLSAVLKYAPDLSTWHSRAQSIRQDVLNGAQLNPLPPKTPLNPIINQLKNRTGYTIQNIAFEATPGFFVTGNLFIPTQGTGPFPAIIVPHGHFGSWAGFARTLPENQILVTRLVQMGAVVFTFDMVGWGDSLQLNHPDSYGFLGFGNDDHFKDGSKNNLLAVELWDSIRSVDFIQSLQDVNGNPLVDSNRIGVTGASGGATQSLYLATVDPRISAAALVVMITAGFTGDDYCEDGMPVHNVNGQGKTNNTEMAATFAPKPLLIISDGNDWTQWFPHDEYPYMKRIWNFFGVPNQTLNFHFPHEVHDYAHNKRARAYQFFSTAFGLQVLPNTGSGVDDNYEGVPLEDRDSLKVFTTEFPRPNYPMTHLEGR